MRARRRHVHLQGPARHPRVGEDGQEPKNAVGPDDIYAEVRRRHVALTRCRWARSTPPRAVEHPGYRGLLPVLAALWRNLVDERPGRSGGRRGPGATTDADPVAAPDDSRPCGRLRGPPLQHRRRQADRAEQPPDPSYAGRGPAASVAEPLVLMMAPDHPARRRGALGPDGVTTRPRSPYEPFPVADPAFWWTDTVEYPVQVNGPRPRPRHGLGRRGPRRRGVRRPGRREGASRRWRAVTPRRSSSSPVDSSTSWSIWSAVGRTVG